MIAKGVLLVDLTKSNRRPQFDWPTPDVNLLIADHYDAATREHAKADLIEFLVANGLEKDDAVADAYSRGMLDSSDGPSMLYGRLAAKIATRSFEI